MRCHFSTAQQTRGGAPCTLAPEIANLVYAEDGTAVFDYSCSDLYSAGLVALEIVMCGRGGDEAAAAEAIPEVWAIVQSMLVHEPSKRATPRKVIAALDTLVVERGTARFLLSHGRTEVHQFLSASERKAEAMEARLSRAAGKAAALKAFCMTAEKKAEATKEELRTAAAAWKEAKTERDAEAAAWKEKNVQLEAELVQLKEAKAEGDVAAAASGEKFVQREAELVRLRAKVEQLEMQQQHRPSLTHRGSSSTPARTESAASSQASAGEARRQPGQRRSSLTPGGGGGSAASPQASASGARNFRSAARRVVEAGRSRLAGTPRTPLSTKAATPLSSIVRSGIRRRKSVFDHDHNLDSETQLTGSPSLRTPTGTAATRALNLTPSTDRYEDVGKPLRKLYFRCGHISYNMIWILLTTLLTSYVNFFQLLR